MEGWGRCWGQWNEAAAAAAFCLDPTPPHPITWPWQIRFSTKSFGVEAAEVAARAIENVADSLVDADMSDIIAGRPGRLPPPPSSRRCCCCWPSGCPRCQSALLLPGPGPLQRRSAQLPYLPSSHSPCHPLSSAAEAEALGALRIISAALSRARLRHLNLSDNALGEKGIRACAAAFVEQARRAALSLRYAAPALLVLAGERCWAGRRGA